MSDGSGGGVVGRAEPLQRLGEVVAASINGRSSAVLVSGEAGIGKTSLISAAIDGPTADGIPGSAVIGWGTCWHGDGAPGFWPWMQAFDEITNAVGHDVASAAAGHNAGLLSLLIRELGAPESAVGDQDGRRLLLLLEAAAGWLETLAADQHVVVVLDDLQWADSSTFDLIDYVIGTPRTAQLLLIGAFRHDELDQERRARLATISSHARRVHLDGLTVDGVEELIRAIPGPPASRSLAVDLHRRTGGHPLFVGELARLRAAGDLAALPTVVTGAVSRRLDALPTESQRLLQVASVLGNRLLLDVLGAVTKTVPAAVLGHLTPAVDAGLVRTAPGDEFWFTHDIYRETLYSELDAADRSGLHAAVGAALEVRRERGAEVPPGDVALHYVHAIATVEPARAIRWASEAAQHERRRLAFSEAAGHLRRVRLAAIDGGWRIEPDVMTRLLMDEADNQARSGDPEASRGLLVQALRAAPGAEALADVALAMQRLGAKFSVPRDEIITQLETALAAVTGVSLTKQAQLTAALARELQHSVAKDRYRAGPLSEEALTLGRQSGHDETIAACLLARHDALWGPGTGTERAELGREIAAIGAALGDIDRQAEGLILEANGLLESGDARFRSVLAQWFDVLTARNEPRDRYMVQTRRAALALLDGDVDLAETLMDEAGRIGEQIHEPDTGNVLMSQRVALASARRDPDELRTLAADAVRWWTGAPVLAHAVAAGALAKAGDLEGAESEVAKVDASGGWQSEGSYLRSVLVGHLAEASVALGDRELCVHLLADIEDIADACGVNGAVVAFAGPFAHSAGILASVLGDQETARSMLHQSIETSRRLGAVVWVRQGEAALRAIEERPAVSTPDGTDDSEPGTASLIRQGRVWTISWHHETGTLPHLKGLADIATLISRRDQEVSALELAGGPAVSGVATDAMADRQSLDTYRRRLDDLDAEIDVADRDADLGRTELLHAERQQLLAELRRVTGLGGRIRSNPNDPAERARKAVSGRIRDAIGRLAEITPGLAAHLDRSIHTGLRCSYSPLSHEKQMQWKIET
jgi:hypothetical protein